MNAKRKINSHLLIQLCSLGLLMALLLTGCAPTAAPAAAPAPAQMSAPTTPITGIAWQWTSVTQQGTTTTIPDPPLYTIVFNTDGTVKGKADCNTFSGTYSQQNGFTIKVTPDVMSACGTLDSQFITLLNQVAAGGPDGAGGLALETAGGEQRMLFKNGGLAPK